MRDMFSLHVSKGRQRRQRLPGVVAVAVQFGDALFLTVDMPFAIGHRLLGNGQVRQFHLAVHGAALRSRAVAKGTRTAGTRFDLPQQPSDRLMGDLAVWRNSGRAASAQRAADP